MISNRHLPVVPLRCCQKCYNKAIFYMFGLVGGELGRLNTLDFREKFAYVRDHSECDICNLSIEKEGFDPCDDFQFSSNVECFDFQSPVKGKNIFIRIFHSTLCEVVVDREGDIGTVFDYKISNWIVEVDNS